MPTGEAVVSADSVAQPNPLLVRPHGQRFVVQRAGVLTQPGTGTNFVAELEVGIGRGIPRRPRRRTVTVRITAGGKACPVPANRPNSARLRVNLTVPFPVLAQSADGFAPEGVEVRTMEPGEVPCYG